MPNDSTRLPIVLIHRDETIRARLGRVLDGLEHAVLVASVRTPEASVSAVAEHADAVVLMEQQPTDGTGRVAAVEQLRQMTPRTQVVSLITDIDAPSVMADVRSGVTGIWRHDLATIPEALRLTAMGVCVFDPDALAVLVGTLTDLPRNPLSSRERQVLSCLANGLSNAEAATQLFVSRETVKTHVAHVLRKLDVDDRLAAVDKAVRIGLLA